jgi:transposase
MEKLVDRNPNHIPSLVLPALHEELNDTHLCSFLRHTLAELNVRHLRNQDGEEGHPAYSPEMLLSVWLYAYVLRVTSSRWLEQKIRKDSAFRNSANGVMPDHQTLSVFRRRHRKELNDVFTEVMESARASGFSLLGVVAIDSTRVMGNASRDTIAAQSLRNQRKRIRQEIRRWQQRCDEQDSNEGVRLETRTKKLVRLGRQRQEIPQRL